MRIARAVATTHAAALARFDVYVIPALVPDLREGAGKPSVMLDSPRAKPARRPIDDDRDGRVDEDPPSDLDGDGRVLWMRVRNPSSETGLTADMVPEKDDPRLLRKAQRTKGELPVYAVLTESTDRDGDGSFGEDGVLGVDIDRNFPYRWTEFRDEAGRVPLSEPDARALVEWLQARPNVLAVIGYSSWDTIVNTPGGGKMDQTGAAPAESHVLDDDREFFVDMASAYKEITRQERAPSRDNAGSLQGWAYAQVGLWSMNACAWVRADQLKKPDKPKQAEEGQRPEASPETPAANAPPETPRPKSVESEEGRWITLSDASAGAGGSPGFIDWKPFDHPILGEVEIGGFVPGFRQDIPEAELDRLAGEQASFVANVVGRLPRLEVATPTVERLGEGVWRISASVRNEGALPTRSAMGVRVRRHAPTRLELEIEPERFLSGRPSQGREAVAPGETLRGSWVIRGEPGTTVNLRLRSPECGDRTVAIELSATKENVP